MAQDPAKPAGSGSSSPQPPRSVRPPPRPGTLAAMYEDEVAPAPSRARPVSRPIPKLPSTLLPYVARTGSAPTPAATVPKTAADGATLPASSTAGVLPRAAPAPGDPAKPDTSPALPTGAVVSRPRPGASTAAVTRSGDYCSQCRTTLGRDSEKMGLALRINDKLICDRCHRSNLSRTQQQKSHRTIGLTLGLAALGLAVAGVFLPSEVIFLGVGAGLAATIIGALGFTLSGRTRLLCVCAGLAATTGSFWGLSALREKSELARAQERYGGLRAEIDELLAQDEYASAHSRRLVLRTKAENARDPEALKVVQSADKAFDAWFERHYRSVDARTQTVLERLLLSYPVKSTHGTFRFKSAQVEDRRVTLVFATDWQNPVAVEGAKQASVSEEALREIATISTFLFSLVPSAESVEIEVHHAIGGAAIGHFSAGRGDLPSLTRTAPLEDLAAMFKELNN
ncbi:MAG TPA: hypothetical protein VEK08_15455 [Planctomycetota bacterium]|nr:hypothetical protein [Planctomycetota bacterium]